MPQRKTYRRPARRYYRKKKSFPRRRRITPKRGYSRVPFPIVRYVKLHLNYVGSITSTTGSFGKMESGNGLRLNSCHDPLNALGSQQPRWWDQLAALYSKYAVYGCKVVAVFSGSEKIGQVALGGWDASEPSSMLEMDERENCQTRVIDASTGSKTQIVLKRYFRMFKMVGIPKKQYVNEDDYLTTIGSDPGNVIYGNCFFQAYAAQTSSVNVKIHMTFYVKLCNITDPADS